MPRKIANKSFDCSTFRCISGLADVPGPKSRNQFETILCLFEPVINAEVRAK